MTKITERNIYTALINFAQTGATPFFENAEGEKVEVTQEMLLTFAEKKLAALDKRNEKAKAKKSEEDVLLSRVAACLTDEFEPISTITTRVELEDATASKVAYRLNKLVESGVAEKDDIKLTDENGKKLRSVKGYRLVQEQCVEGDEE